MPVLKLQYNYTNDIYIQIKKIYNVIIATFKIKLISIVMVL